MTGPALYSAEPCGTSDPAPGVRLLREGAALDRLSAREALRLAGELIAAGLDSLAAPPLVTPPDEFALSRAVWALLEDSGHGDCGGWSRKPGGDVRCTCGAVVAVTWPAAEGGEPS